MLILNREKTIKFIYCRGQTNTDSSPLGKFAEITRIDGIKNI